MKNKAFHWLVVGFVSDGAKEWIEEEGGKVLTLCSDPLLIGVALAYDAAGTWVWSKGRQVYSKGVQYWSTGELQEASTGITLLYGNVDGEIAEYCSAETNYVILPDEAFDKTTRTARVPDLSAREASIFSFDDDGLLNGLDDCPF